MSKILKIGNRVLKIGSRVLEYTPSAIQEWQTFTCLSYFMKLSDLGLSGTNFRYYNKGEAAYSEYSDNPSRFAKTTSSTTFGSMNTVYVDSVYTPGNWTTYQFMYTYTPEDLNNLIDGNGLQIEIVYMNTSTTTPYGNYARYWIDTFPVNLWNSGTGYNFSASYLDSDGFSGAFTLSNVVTSNNWSYSYGRARRAKDTSDWHHLVIVISKKNNYIRFWDNGVLSFMADLTWNKTDAEIRSAGYMLNANLANLQNMYVSQLGVREAVWTEARDYTPPTQAYLAVEDYF